MCQPEETLARLLETGFRQRGEKTAIIFEGVRYSYTDIQRRVSARAAEFRADGLEGERIALILPNGIELICCYLACFQMGAVATPMSHDYAVPELLRSVELATPRLVVIHSTRRDLLEAFALQGSGHYRVLVAGPDALADRPLIFMRGSEPDLAAIDRPEDSAALMFFTSGSTGKPKAVLHSCRSALAILTSTCEALDDVAANDVILVCEPQVHPSGFIATFSVLMRGGTVVLLEEFEALAYLKALRSTRPSLIVTHIDILMKLLRAPGIRRQDFASLRGVYTGGDGVSAERQQQFQTFTGLPIQIGWGMTEAIWLTICRVPLAERQGCIGHPVGGTQIRIAGRQGEELPDGEAGEFWVKGPMVMLKYWGDPETTTKSFEDGWFRTGDSGSRDANGTYLFGARIKDLIVRNSSKITPGEVEAALDLHPDITAAAVVGAPDADEGEVPVAFVVPALGYSVNSKKLTEFLQTKLADYKIPARFYAVEKLPLTRSGKIDRNVLKALSAPDTVHHGQQ